ncbi:hypothetical protein AAW00_06305 [Aurantiacibacter luteus]|uniref:Nucleoside hydrolase n=2 Tax=Aurantiacibacter luteus TaxID=1581420 RepID=A0A0G9N3R2_9SPHN|nr:hypothetical protein AAW00_06305 [Aurantiacibacter luteus]
MTWQALRPLSALASHAPQVPRMRVICDNDFSGDPDGLFQLAHHLLSPSVTIPFIVGSHIHVDDFLDGSRTQADNAAARALALIAAMGLSQAPEVLIGVNAVSDIGSSPSALTRRIIAEAERDDTDLPLVYAAGAGLTELAEALRAAPHIAGRMRLAWIGGPEWEETPLPVPSRGSWEYNFHIDIAATQFVFNDSGIEIWQVPRQTYRQVMVSMPELERALEGAGSLGTFLLDALSDVRHRWPDHMGETFILGDNPLVTLTALMSSFEPDTSSSAYVVRPTPMVTADGTYNPRPGARPMRIFNEIDTRLTLADMFAKFARHAA